MIERHGQPGRLASIVQALSSEPQGRVEGFQLGLDHDGRAFIKINAGVSREHAHLSDWLIHGRYPFD
jgi:hypothetical protein